MIWRRLKQAETDIAAKPDLLDIYPVGAIYISVDSTSPGTLFGGTWSAFGAGRVLIGIDAGQTEFDTVEETGGAKTQNLQHTHSVTSNVAVSDHSNHTHSVTSNVAVGNHSDHTMSGNTGQASAGATQRGTTSSTLTLSTHTHSVGTLAVSAHSAHSVTNNAVTSGNESATLTHSVTNNAVISGNGGSTTQSVMNPYIVVYMWKRTA